MRPEFRNYLRSGYSSLESDEALRARPGALVGVSAAMESALASVNINSIFDLAVSQLFVAASKLLTIGNDPTTAEARLNIVASDLASLPAGLPVTELADQPITILLSAGSNGAALAAALDVATVRELALWPPFVAAKALLSEAFFAEQAPDFDPDAPDDLLPKNRVYPTERVFLKKLVMDVVPGDGARAIEDSPAIDLAAALSGTGGFDKLATGALLTFSQSWFSHGLTLGQLLHSTSLAPGESTRVAVIDWSRRSSAAASENISESELLSNTMAHSRSISEVTAATASEFQTGRSTTLVNSTAEQGGIGSGLEIGPLAIGASGATSTTTTEVMSASSSFGARELAANYAQEINDRSQQNASSVRNRRASVVREVSQSEHETISTRVVTNYNHMHALSVHYYEVVQAFKTTTQLERAERCLFIPVKLVDFTNQSIVDRWRLVLAEAALSERARRQLTVEYGVVEIIAQTPRITPGGIIVSGVLDRSVLSAVATASAAAVPPSPASPTAPAPPPEAPEPAPAPAALTDYARAPLNSPAALLAIKGWDIDQLNRIGWSTGRILMQAGSDSVFVSDDALVVGFSLRSGEATRFVVRLRNGQEVSPGTSTNTSVAFASPVAITDIESISVQYMGGQPLKTSLVLQLNLLGTIMPLDVPVQLRSMTAPVDVVKFGGVKASRELVAHLEANRLHYTQAILKSIDAATAASLLSQYTYRGIPVGQLVDSQPVAVTANFLVFKLNVGARGDADDPRWNEEQSAWQRWLEQRGLDRPAPRSEIIPLPSGGVFAEAVLGRYNSAEKADLTRFWNWQDSPIPIAAPEIAAVQAGSRAQSDDIKPGQLSAPVLNIQAPTALPDPAGIAAIVAALQNGNMFRDMSGMMQTAALAQAAIQASAQGATAVGQQAGQNLATLMANNTERMKIAAQLLAAMAGGPAGAAAAGGANSLGGRSAANVTEEGARLNYAKGMDARGAVAGEGASMGSIPGSGEPGSDFGGGSTTAAPGSSTEADLFNRITGGAAEDFAGRALDTIADQGLLGGGAGGGGGGGGVGGGAAARPGSRQSRARRPAPRLVYLRHLLSMDDSNLPFAMRQYIRIIRPRHGFNLLIKGFVRFEIASDDGDLDQLYHDLNHDVWQRLPFDSDTVVQSFRTTASGFYITIFVLPEPIVFTPTVFDPNDDARKSFIRRSSIRVDVMRNPKIYPIEIQTRLRLKYTEAFPPNHMTLKDFLPGIQIMPEDVVYVGPRIVTPAGDMYPVVSYDVGELDLTENTIAGELRQYEMPRN